MIYKIHIFNQKKCKNETRILFFRISFSIHVPLCPRATQRKSDQSRSRQRIFFWNQWYFWRKQDKANFFDLLIFPEFYAYYEKVIDENSSYGTGMFINFSGDYSSNAVQRRFAISIYYRLYFLNRSDFGASGIFLEAFSSFASSKDNNNDKYDVLTESYMERSNIFRFSIGFSLGRKWISRSRYTYEPFVGVGRYLDYRSSNGSNPEAHLRFGFSIGNRS